MDSGRVFLDRGKEKRRESETKKIGDNKPPEHLPLIHISEPTRLLSIPYAVVSLNKKFLH